MERDIDFLDKCILSYLSENSKLTNKELSGILPLSSTSIFNRRQKLEKSGYIFKYKSIINQELLELGQYYLVNIVLLNLSRDVIQAFTDSVNSYSEVLECFLISGSADFMLKISTKDDDHYFEFMNVLAQIEAIQTIKGIKITRIMIN